MEQDKAFFLKWYGPFTSKDELKNWELQQPWDFHLYLLHGKRKYAKTKECYYCGKTIRTAYKRFNDAGHHIEEIENREHSIYVARFANASILDNKDILLVEKLITSYLGWYIGEDLMLNKTNFYAPNCNTDICVINRWYNWKTSKEYNRTPVNSPAHLVPDVMVYRYDNHTKESKLVVSPRLKIIW